MNFKKLKSTLIITVLLCIVSSLAVTVLTITNYNKYISQNNQAIISVVSLFLENDDLNKSEILTAIENPNTVNSDILKEYGYNLDTQFFIENNKINLSKNIFINLLIVNGFVVLMMRLFYIFLKKQDEKINKTVTYLQRLQQKNYNLEIEENNETEFSKLQNEIYKITIFLKEQAEKSISDKNQIKNNIVDISHQLKTPITSLSIMTENMLEYPNMDEKTKRKFLENMKDRINHLEMLVQNLLKLSRFDANVIEFVTDEINVSKLILTAINKNEQLIEQKEIEVDVECDESITFHGDIIWESEALSNIIKNAVEHSYQQGKIKISVKSNNFFTRILVTDYGQGIKKENLQNIFKRYYKDENSNENSLGVGLNLAKTIIEKDQGIIKAYSKIGEYTTFEILFQKF